MSDIRRLLGKSLTYVDGKIDVVASFVSSIANALRVGDTVIDVQSGDEGDPGDVLTLVDSTHAEFRPPTGTGGVPTSRAISSGTGLTGGGDLSVDRTLSVVYGTTAGTSAQGNDSRLSNARTPTAHAASHGPGGSDETNSTLPLNGAVISGNITLSPGAYLYYVSASCTITLPVPTRRIAFKLVADNLDVTIVAPGGYFMEGAQTLSSEGRTYVEYQGAGFFWRSVTTQSRRAYLDAPEVLHVEDFVAQGFTLNSSTFHDALDAAIAALYARPKGGKIVLPAGVWDMESRSLSFGATGHAGDTAKHIRIEGAGKRATVLKWPSAFTGRCIEIDGYAPSGPRFFHGSFARFTVASDWANTSTATGVYVQEGLFVDFDEIDSGTFGGVGGKAWYFDGGDGAIVNNQDCSLFKCDAFSSETGTFLRGCTQFLLSHFTWNQNTKNHIVFDGYYNDICIISPLFQGTTTDAYMTTSSPNEGGNHVQIMGLGYCEGAGTAILKTHEPTEGYDWFDIAGLNINVESSMDAAFDLTGTGRFTLFGLRNSRDALVDKVIKASRVRVIQTDLDFTPESAPEKFELDQPSYQGYTSLAAGTLFVGEQNFAPTLRELLKQYAVEIYDPRLTDLTTHAGGTVSEILGYLHGDPAESDGNEPLYVESEPVFGGAPCFESEFAENSGLIATLSVPAAAGSNPGLFVVMAASNTSTTEYRRIQVRHPSNSDAIFVGIDQPTPTGSILPYAGTFVGAMTGVWNSALAPGLDAHVILNQATYTQPTSGIDSKYPTLYVDESAGIPYGPFDADIGATNALPELQMPVHGGATIKGSCKIAFVAPLRIAMPPAVAARAMVLARLEFAPNNATSAVVTITSNTIARPGYTYLIDASAGDVTLTLPDPPSAWRNRAIEAKRIDASANEVHVVPFDAESWNLDNEETYDLLEQYHGIIARSDGSDAWIVAEARPPIEEGVPSHAVSHQNGGTDEISVAGLSGLLADGQTPLSHAASHQHGGADQIATATPGANAIPKAGAAGTLDPGWMSPAPATGQVLVYDGTNADWTYGGRQVLTANKTITTSLANISGFSWALKSGVRYVVQGALLYNKTTNNGTIGVSLNYSAGITNLMQTAQMSASITGGGDQILANTTNNTAMVSNSVTAPGNGAALFAGSITPSADGTLNLAAIASTVDALLTAGSWMAVQAAEGVS